MWEELWPKQCLSAAAGSKSAAAVARSCWKNKRKQLSSECGRQQRSSPCPLMWLLAVPLAVSSLLITPQQHFTTQTSLRQLIISGLLCQLIVDTKQRRKCRTQRLASLQWNSRQYDDGALVLSVVAWLWISCTTVHKLREVCGDWAAFYEGGKRMPAKYFFTKLREVCRILNKTKCIVLHIFNIYIFPFICVLTTTHGRNSYEVCDSVEPRRSRKNKVLPLV